MTRIDDLSPALRSNARLIELDGIVEEREGHVVVRSPDNPGWWHGNSVLFEGPPPTFATLEAHWSAAFPDDVRHRCFAWGGDEADADVVRAAAARGFHTESSIEFELRSPSKRDDRWQVRELGGDDDHAAFAALNRASDGGEADASDEYANFKERIRARFLSWMRTGRARWFAAFDGATPIGQCGLVLQGEVGRFQAVETHPDWRRRGVASAVVHAAAEHAFGRQGCTSVLLEAEPDGPALGMYTALGFEEIGRVRALVRPSEPARIRTEVPADHAGVRSLVRAAFDSDEEPRLVDALRVLPATMSLVAERGGTLLGHVMLSEVHVPGARTTGVALAPMSVTPRYQRTGIGTQLGHAALEAARAAGHGWCVVLGHREYYPRFGFTPASAFGLTSRWPAPDDCFLAMELSSGSLAEVRGVVEYTAGFRAP